MPAAQLAGLDPMAAYRVIAWLAWVPNLILAELYVCGAQAARPAIA